MVAGRHYLGPKFRGVYSDAESKDIRLEAAKPYMIVNTGNPGSGEHWRAIAYSSEDVGIEAVKQKVNPTGAAIDQFDELYLTGKGHCGLGMKGKGAKKEAKKAAKKVAKAVKKAKPNKKTQKKMAKGAVGGAIAGGITGAAAGGPAGAVGGAAAGAVGGATGAYVEGKM